MKAFLARSNDWYDNLSSPKKFFFLLTFLLVIPMLSTIYHVSLGMVIIFFVGAWRFGGLIYNRKEIRENFRECGPKPPC